MDVLIDASGHHMAPGHLIRVDQSQTVVDLSNVVGDLHDPTILRVTWGMLSKGGDTRPGGTITLVDGTKRTFFDYSILTPYLTAFDATIAQRRADQVAYDAAHPR